jgi:hypothetical protein
MKTFDEACKVFVQSSTLNDLAEGTVPEEARLKRAELNSRYRELHQEIYQNRHYKSLVCGHLFQLEHNSVTLEEVIFSVFCYGVGVGMEMEKSE